MTSTMARPDPDELLRRLQSEDARRRRGRLKIFVGYAPRVGKSERMFEEGLRRLSRGQDVIVGAVQQKGSAELQQLIRRFEVIPLHHTSGGQVLDVSAILARRPAVCLIDELAYDNPSGWDPPHRWQQVGDLLDGGVTVVTALNLQHIRERQDAVERITGKRSAHAVPESFIRSAGEIVIVDAPSNDLAALDHDAGKARQLAELRELALLLSADVVELQLQHYLDEHNIHQSWGTQERILVCITPASNARSMIESGRRNAERSHGQLFALSVTTRETKRAAREVLDANLDIARRAGADVTVVESDDPIQAISDFARIHRITQIFIGHTRRRRWLPWMKTPVDRIIEAAEGVDVRIFPQ